jgi:ribonuclease P protein component
MPTSLLQRHRLQKHADYQRVYQAGRKQFSRQIAYFYALRAASPEPASPDPAAAEPAAPTGAVPARPSRIPATVAGPRIGLTVPKAMLARAHDRNRMKRRMREAIRAALPALSADVDLILHPRRGVLTLDFATLQQELTSIFRLVERQLAPATPPAAPSSAKPSTEPSRG